MPLSKSKILLISIFVLCSSFSRSTTFNERAVCEENKGVWREFGRDCADECEAQFDELALCTDIVNYGCECGKSRCWNSKTKTCVALSAYKKIFLAAQAEQKKVTDEAKKKREEEAQENQEKIIQELDAKKDEPTLKQATPAPTQQPQTQPPVQAQPLPPVATTPAPVPPMFLDQEKAKQEAQKKKQEAEKKPIDLTPMTPGLPVIPLPQ